MDSLLAIHSFVRWLILLVAVLGVVKFTPGWLRGGPFAGMDRGLAAGFSGLMDLQVLLGLTFLLWSGFAGAGFPVVRLEHAGAMIAAAAAAHLPVRWRGAPDKLRYRNTLLAVLGSLALVLIGVSTLPQGWS
ncbi:MAG: hypothetical protein HY784_07570 [Chloroflexi bacterium]|nr:hypothetical protein [Chloroflexota bacterium]